MKKIEAIIRHFKLEDVKNALTERGIARRLQFVTGHAENGHLPGDIAWDSLADRETKWNAFQADPEWHTKRAETEAAGPIVERVENMFLAPTAFSSVK